MEPFCRFNRQKIHSVFIKETAMAEEPKGCVLFSSFTRTACLSSRLWGLVLHSDQRAQDTSKAFVEYCESVGVTQSMSRAGCPYDNTSMERYFNTLKNEYVRSYSFNGYQTPYQARNE